MSVQLLNNYPITAISNEESFIFIFLNSGATASEFIENPEETVPLYYMYSNVFRRIVSQTIVFHVVKRYAILT